MSARKPRFNRGTEIEVPEMLISASIFNNLTESDTPLTDDVKYPSKEEQGVDEQFQTMSDSSQMQHTKTYPMLEAVKRQTRNTRTVLRFHPHLTPKTPPATIGLWKRKQGATPGDVDQAIVRSQANQGCAAPFHVQ
ncbi:unnamed protein product [Penicillium bialowiezense]